MSLEYKIINRNSDDFKEILKLNLEVFPQNELLAPINLEDPVMASDENLKIFAFYDGGKFIGYAALYLYKELCYLAFLAIWPQFQGCSYGSKILDILNSNFNQIVLEIEYLDPKADDIDQRIRRSKFYQKSGFCDSTHTISYLGMKYSIYTSSKVEFERFIQMFEFFKSKNYFEFNYE
ncbi:GNAT family N-acetyltransferase [Campylobacter sp. CX2-8023-23]|uniref:GNAT family N-acetyltransferase n=1 Tax=Campylobacter porcelli TaxID=1660073 RepID=UPI000A3452C2|nr:GNAT family N-acetyltransferase [Campylobacter sp. P0078]MEE3704488.1 GNAT family N-acetyltransferase [Campylobacter sp. CX2-8023-23]